MQVAQVEIGDIVVDKADCRAAGVILEIERVGAVSLAHEEAAGIGILSEYVVDGFAGAAAGSVVGVADVIVGVRWVFDGF